MYKVTGILRNGKRFKAIHTSNREHALGINLWSGTVWSWTGTKWAKIKSV